MSKKFKRPQAPKVRNHLAGALARPDSPFREKVIPDKNKDPVDKFGRKAKHKWKI